MGQTRSQSAGTSSDEPSVYPDPRKLSAQEKNLLRIRSLEREKQEGWEVMMSREEVSRARGTGRTWPPLQGSAAHAFMSSESPLTGRRHLGFGAP